MLEFLVEMDLEDLKLGVDTYSLGNISIKGELSSITSDDSSMMIFISLSELLSQIINLFKGEIKQYQFVGVDSSFTFHIINRINSFVITDSKKKIIARATSQELIQSVWKGISEFYNAYRPLIKDPDEIVDDLDNTLNKFQTQFSDILNSSEKSIKEQKPDISKSSKTQTTQDDLSHFSPYVYPPKPDHIIPTGIEGLLTVYFAKDYDELVEQYGFRRLITQIVAQYKEDQHPAAVKHCLNEVSILVSHEQNEKYLRDKIVNEYGVKIPISKLGGSYQIFLERLHEELVGKRLYT